MLRWFLLVLAALCCASASLTVFRAPSLATWKVAILVDEYGNWLVLLTLLTGSLGYWTAPRAGFAWGTAALCALATLFLLRPLVAAWAISRTVPAELMAAFGPAATFPQPFSVARLYAGARVAPVGIETRIFSRAGTPEAMALDFYRAQGRAGASAPCVITIHGGGWDNGDRTQLPEINHRLARLGYAVAAVDYRLAPKFTWPAARDDVRAAMVYLKAHAAELGIDPTCLVLFGRSAGGQIATAVAYEDPDPGLRGVAAFYSPFDMRFAWAYARPDDVLNSFLLLQQYLGGTPEACGPVFDSASAYFHVTPATLPTLLIHGELDTLVWHRQSERLDARLAAEHVPHLFISLPWATHAFDYNLDGPAGQLATGGLEAFLAAVTAPAAGGGRIIGSATGR